MHQQWFLAHQDHQVVHHLHRDRSVVRRIHRLHPDHQVVHLEFYKERIHQVHLVGERQVRHDLVHQVVHRDHLVVDAQQIQDALRQDAVLPSVDVVLVEGFVLRRRLVQERTDAVRGVALDVESQKFRMDCFLYAVAVAFAEVGKVRHRPAVALGSVSVVAR